MNHRLKVSAVITIIASVFISLWIIFSVISLVKFQLGLLVFEQIGEALQLRIIFAVVYHILILYFLIVQFRYYNRFIPITLIAFIVGIVSFIMIAGEWSSLHDISYDLRSAKFYDKNELLVLILVMSPQFVFSILSFISAKRFLKGDKSDFGSQRVVIDEVMFQTIHYTGLICGFLGVFFFIALLSYKLPTQYMYVILILYGGFLLLPYLVSVIYWIMIKKKEKQAGWSDEKQIHDLSKAGLITLLMSIPVLTIVFVLGQIFKNIQFGFLWFPIYIFSIIFSFSLITLFLTRHT